MTKTIVTLTIINSHYYPTWNHYQNVTFSAAIKHYLRLSNPRTGTQNSAIFRVKVLGTAANGMYTCRQVLVCSAKIKAVVQEANSDINLPRTIVGNSTRTEEKRKVKIMWGIVFLGKLTWKEEKVHTQIMLKKHRKLVTRLYCIACKWSQSNDQKQNSNVKPREV